MPDMNETSAVWELTKLLFQVIQSRDVWASGRAAERQRRRYLIGQPLRDVGARMFGATCA